MAGVHDFTARSIDGEVVPLAGFRGRVLLIVNTASRCGFTPHYAGLQALHERFAPRRFAVLGFPCNQFGRQEPGDEAEIASFCAVTYGVRFPLFAKVEVNGPGAHPLFAYLTAARPGLFGTRRVKWNFTKFLVDAGGTPVRRFGPATRPERIAPHVEALLRP
jgi:glutathione peroxidase